MEGDQLGCMAGLRGDFTNSGLDPAQLERLRNSPPLPPSTLDPTASTQTNLELLTRRLEVATNFEQVATNNIKLLTQRLEVAETEVETAKERVENHFSNRDPTTSEQTDHDQKNDFELLTQRLVTRRLKAAEAKVARVKAELEAHLIDMRTNDLTRFIRISNPNIDLTYEQLLGMWSGEEREEREEEEDTSSMPPLEYNTDEDDSDFQRSANIDCERLPVIVNCMPAHVKTIYLNAKAKETEADTCPVCLEAFDFEDHKSIHVTMCGHLIHTSCHNERPIRTQNQCVVCRADYKA